MTAAISAPVEAMSRGQLEAAVKLLREAVEAARRYRDEVERTRPVVSGAAEVAGIYLDRALTKLGMP